MVNANNTLSENVISEKADKELTKSIVLDVVTKMATTQDKEDVMNFVESLDKVRVNKDEDTQTFYVNLVFKLNEGIRKIHIFTSIFHDAIEDIEDELYQEASMAGIHYYQDSLTLSFFFHPL
jgi:hypothetical protein